MTKISWEKWAECFPKGLRTKIRLFLLDHFFSDQMTIAEGWDSYARRYQTNGSHKLGDEWNESQILGMDVPDKDIPRYLDEKVFSPFLGQSEVILEIGSGGGRFTELLLPKCRRMLAADTSPAMLDMLRKRFKGQAKLDYIFLDGRGLTGVPDNSVDVVFSFDVFVHLQHWDIYNYVAEAARVLRPGGKALIHHANIFSNLGWKRFREELFYSTNRHKLPWTFSLMTPDIMREFAARAGLKVQDILTDVVRRDAITLMTK